MSINFVVSFFFDFCEVDVDAVEVEVDVDVDAVDGPDGWCVLALGDVTDDDAVDLLLPEISLLV